MIRPGIRRAFRLPVWRRDVAEEELDEEVRLHIELRAEQLERQGLSPEAARAEAHRHFAGGDGDHRMLRRAARRRDQRLQFREWLSSLQRDVREVGRVFRRHPFYALGVAGTLGLGLATATLVFVVAWRVWLAPMPYPDPDRVLRLYEIQPSDGTAGAEAGIDVARRHHFSPGLLEEFRTHSWRTIDAVSERGSYTTWIGGDESQTVSATTLSPEGYGILGIVPTLGRLPTETEREVVLSERFWRAHFGSDPGVVGSTMRVGPHLSLRVVGVARVPGGYPGEPDFVGVIDRRGDDDRALRFIETIARVRSGFSVAEAQAEIDAFLTALAQTNPTHRGWSVEAVVLADDLVRPFRGVLVLLLAAGATFLLLAAANVLGLVAARRVESRHDRAIRLALGATEGRLLRGSLIESLVLAGVGCTIGVLSAYWFIGPLRALVPHEVPRLAEAAVTPALGLGVLTVGLLLGAMIGAAAHLISRDARPAVGRAPMSRRVSPGSRRALIVGQIALTTLLTAAAIAILHRVSTLNAVDLGFEPQGLSSTVITGGPDSSPEQWPNVWATHWSAILDGLATRGIPAALAFNPPMAGEDEALGLRRLGIRADAASEEVFYRAHVVAPGYFSVMGIRLITGRAFEPTDDASAPKLALVSAEFAKRYLPPGTPVDQIIGRTLEPVVTLLEPATVVGVVGSTRHVGPGAPIEPDVYVSYAQQVTVMPRTLFVRGDPRQAAEAVSSVIGQVDPRLRHTPLIPYTFHLREWFAPLRLQLVMVGILGVVGLVLASFGLYSMMAYHVASRRKELAIRKAVGASEGKLMGSVFANSSAMGLVGALLGLAVWYRLLPWTRHLVEGIDGAGALVPVAVTVITGGACILATLRPAARAAHVDPAEVLKVDG